MLYAELISDGDNLQQRGSFGMFSHWQEAAKKNHIGEFNLREALHQLQASFARFADTQRNRDKQAFLLEELARYITQHKGEKLIHREPVHTFKWALTPQVQFTGRTPWVFEREEKYFAYFCQEKEADWQDDLKYPLLQRYMVDNILHCRLSELNMGVYCLETRKFEFKRYSPLEVRNAVQETTQLFTNVYTEYSRLREGAGH
jgi:hypothetical protein